MPFSAVRRGPSMNIIEQIKALPKGGAVTPTEKDGTLKMLPEGFPVITNDSLIALAESHERLLEVIRYLPDLSKYELEVIEQAEKICTTKGLIKVTTPPCEQQIAEEEIGGCDAQYDDPDEHGIHSIRDNRSGETLNAGVAYLPHSCNEWVIGGPDEIRAMIADLQAILREQQPQTRTAEADPNDPKPGFYDIGKIRA
jgi:hypothetical protein